MTINRKTLQKQLCEALCKDVRIEQHDSLLAIDSPFYFPDGDAYQVYLEENKAGGLRLSDKGNLLMRISYEMNVDTLFKGKRYTLRRQILADAGMQEKDGEVFLDTTAEELSEAIFAFGQGMTRLHDMLFLNRSRVESVFYDELWHALRDILGEDKIQRRYLNTDIPESHLYPVDFQFDGKAAPVYLFGILNDTKAQRATIYLEHFRRHGVKFDPVLVFHNHQKIPREDLERLENVSGGVSIRSLEETKELKHEVLAKAA